MVRVPSHGCIEALIDAGELAEQKSRVGDAAATKTLVISRFEQLDGPIAGVGLRRFRFLWLGSLTIWSSSCPMRPSIDLIVVLPSRE